MNTKKYNQADTFFKWITFAFWALIVSTVLVAEATAVRIKDIADIKGVRQNQLVGYGLVVGLEGTGDSDSALFTIQSLASLLEKMGVTVQTSDIDDVENVAAVMVTADLPAFASLGSRLDVLVSSIGDAENLQGGTLLFTPLRAADGNVYAVAQGPVSTGGFAVSGNSGDQVQKNFPTVGRVVGGALVEKELHSNFNQKNALTLALKDPDFTTASRVAQAINRAFYSQLAHTENAGSIRVTVPENYLGNTVQFVTMIESLGVTPDMVSKVVVNERTGTVIMGENVRIATIAIAHGNLSIQINESQDVSQPLPFSRGGETVVTPESEIVVQEGKNPIFLVESGVSIGEVVKALNALGVSPRDLIAIFQALKAAGALQAELEII
ncbi:MAG: flagellar basal body P-ring protein FlgI [Deltaproteobacteria bacterium]|jgi:flagellar P-ring protein precursor FlgI|nr:flagellar basal body P-ring protein FlgI [Deltaproteobacteria bacterium]MBW2487089.1 flagellar basal body P-ring protein FlgI [Deltaproteobacteria bacterium]